MPALARTLALVWLGSAGVCAAGEPFWPDAAARGAAERPSHPPDQQGRRSLAGQSPGAWHPPGPGRLVQPAVFQSPSSTPAESPSGEGTQPAARDSAPAKPASGPAPVEAEGGKSAGPGAREFHLPFGPRGSPKDAKEPPSQRGGAASAVTVAGSLAVVLGVFFLVVWVMRRASPRGSTLLPAEVIEVLGRAPLAGRHQMHLVRCGAKLLLVSVTPAGAETLTEIDDPDEVARLAGLCRQALPNSSTATFRHVFDQLSREGSVLGFLRRRQDDALDDAADDAWKEARRG